MPERERFHRPITQYSINYKHRLTIQTYRCNLHTIYRLRLNPLSQIERSLGGKRNKEANVTTRN